MVHIGVIDSGVNREFVKSYHVNIESAAIFNINPSKSCIEIIEYEKDDIEKWKKGFINHLSDESGHGTAVLSILYQKCPNVYFSLAKILESDNKGYSICLVEALNWMIDIVRPNFMNISLGTDDERIKKKLYRLTKKAKKMGINIYSAIGGEKSYPGVFDTVVGVSKDKVVKQDIKKVEMFNSNEKVKIFWNGNWEIVEIEPSLACAMVLGDTINQKEEN
ncbi:MAG: hypothetical protein ACP5Q5_06830 [Brevinematia bacterium]